MSGGIRTARTFNHTSRQILPTIRQSFMRRKRIFKYSIIILFIFYPRYQWHRNEFESREGHRSKAQMGEPIGRKAPGNFFLVVPLHFLTLKAQLVVLVSAFVMVSTVWSVSCLLFYSRLPPCPAMCKSGGTCPPFPMESAPLLGMYLPEGVGK